MKEFCFEFHFCLTACLCKFHAFKFSHKDDQGYFSQNVKFYIHKCIIVNNYFNKGILYIYSYSFVISIKIGISQKNFDDRWNLGI